MKQVYYKQITTEDFYKMKECLSRFNTNSLCDKSLIPMIDLLRQKLEAKKYLLIYYELVHDCTDHCTNASIIRISIWNRHPADYGSIHYNEVKDCYYDDSYEYRLNFLPHQSITYKQEELSLLFNSLNSILNITNNEDRLQEQEDSGERPESRCLVYGGGNRPQLATGRHCDKAGIKEIECSTRGPQIIVSSRNPEILRG